MQTAVKVARAIIVLVLAVVAAPSILAQTSTEAQRKELTTPPEKIEFSPWNEIESDEFSKVYEVQFPSALNSPYPVNNTVRLRAFMPTDTIGTVPCVVLLHYWGATDLRLEAQIGRELNSKGIAAVAMVLPYHMSRTPQGSRSGELALQADPQKLILSMTQSILDLRRTVDWIETRPEIDKTRIGLAGTSLGGIVSALGFGIEPKFKIGSFVLAGSDLAGILWNSSRVVSQREDMRRRGFTEEKLRAALAIIEPGTYLRPIDGRPSLVIAASLDTVVPPANARNLIGLLSDPTVLWLSTGHFGGGLVRGRIVRTVASFFESSFSGQEFKDPASIHAPTLRFGLVYSDERGLQVAVSTDIWQADARGRTFAAVMLTPQGPQGFAGFRVSNGLAIGAMVLPRRTTLGFSWNIAF